MSKIESSAGKALYEQQETKLSQQSAAFIELLTKRGILGDSSIDDDRVRQAKKEKKKSMYHNTLLLLQHYASIFRQEVYLTRHDTAGKIHFYK